MKKLLLFVTLCFIGFYKSSASIDIDATPSGWVPCPPTIYGNCTNSNYLGDIVQMDHWFYNVTDDYIRFRVRKCDQTDFTSDGTVYLKDGDVCGTVVSQVSYSSGEDQIAIDVPISYWVSGSKDFTITITSSSTERFNAGTVNILKECPDFQVSDVESEFVQIYQGQQNVDVSCLIENIGNDQESNDVYFYLSTNTTYSPNDYYIGKNGFNLAGGASETSIEDLDVEPNQSPGGYYVVAIADRDDDEEECQEWNNASFAFVNVNASPDFTVSSITIDDTQTCQNGSFDVTYTIENTGDADASVVRVGFYLSSNQTWGGSDIELNHDIVGGLDAGDSQIISHNINVGSTSANDYYVIAYADDIQTQIEQYENNNILSTSFEVDVLASTSLLSPSDNSTVNSNTPFLDWSSVSNAIEYAVVVRELDNTIVIAENTAGNSYYNVPIGMLNYNQTYKWFAGAELANGEICASEEWEFTITCFDTFEPNDQNTSPNTTAFPTSLGASSYSNSIVSYIVSDSDVDHFEFNTSQSGEITIDLTSLPENYDLELWPSGGATALASSINLNTDDDQIIYEHTGGNADFYIKIYSFYDEFDCNDSYSLSLSWEPTTSGGGLELNNSITTDPSPVIFDDQAIFSTSILNNSAQPWSGKLDLQLLDDSAMPVVLDVIWSEDVFISSNGIFEVSHTSPNVSTSPDDYNLRMVYSDDGGVTWFEVNDASFQHPQPFEIVATPIQLSSAITFTPTNLEQGQAADFDVDVENFGNETFFDSISLQLLDNNMDYLTWLVKDKYSVSSGSMQNLHFHTDELQSSPGTYYLEVVAYSNGEWHQVNENTFTNPLTINIAPPSDAIEVTEPTSVSSYTGGETITVEWTIEGDVGNVSIELRDAADGYIALIEDGIPSDSSPNSTFIIPNCQSTGMYRIKMYETGTGDFEEYSQLFQITKQENCTCDITSPSTANGDSVELVNAADSLCQSSIINDPVDGDTEPFRFATRGELAKMSFVALFDDLEAKPSDAFPSPFLDLQNVNAWYYRYAKALSYLEYDNGITPYDRNLEFKFRANDSIPRAYAVKVLLETFNILPDGNLSEPYSDVDASTDSYAYITKAYDLGIVTNPDGEFRPYEYTLRSEAFLMVYRILKHFTDGTLTKPEPELNDYFCPGNQKPSNFARDIGIDEGNFNHYSVNSFALPGISMTLDFTHEYNAYLTDLPDDFFPIRPLGNGWTHTYNSYIQDVPVFNPDIGDSGEVEQKLIQFYPSGQMVLWDNPEQSYPYECTVETKGVYQELNYVNANTIEVKTKSQTTFRYEKMTTDGKEVFLLTRITDRLDHEIVISYETGEGITKRISSVELVLGNSKQNHRRLLFDYQIGSNYLSEVKINTDVLSDPIIQFVVNEDDDLVTYTDRMGEDVIYKYIKDINSSVSDEEYEQKKHLLFEVQLPKGNTIKNTYEKRKLNSTSANNKLRTDIAIEYNYGLSTEGFSSDVKTTDLELGFTAFEKHIEFDENDEGQVKCVTVNSNISCFEYTNTLHPFLPTKMTDQETNLEIKLAYDSYANVTQREIFLNGESTNPVADYKYIYTYDNNYNDLTSTTDPSGNVVTYDFGANPSQGLVQTITDQESNVTQFDYFLGSGNLWKYGGLKKITSPMDIEVEFDYDLYGNLDNTTSPNNITTSSIYDELGRVSTRTNANNNTYGYTYYANDLVDKIENPLEDEIDYDYDANYNINAIKNERGFTTSITYDFDTDLQETVSFGGNTIEYDYFQEGRLKKVTKPDGTIITPVYQPSGNGIGQLSDDGYATYTYDTENRVSTVTKSYSEGDHIITYHYDNLNRTTSYDYDVTGSNNYSYSIGYEYDTNGLLSKVKYPNFGSSGTLDISYSYYDNYWLKDVTDWEDKKVEFYYHADGGIDYISRPNNTVCKYHYDIDTRRISGKIDSIVNGTVINKYVYVLDDHENIISESRTEPHAEVSYKAMIQSASYQDNNFTDQVNGFAYTINQNGNLENDGQNTYEWDNAFDVLQSINSSISFKYDGLGNRREKLDNGTEIRYIHDMLGMSNVIAELDGNDSPIAYYIYAGNQLLYRKKPSGGNYNDHYYHYNFQGSTVAMTSESSAITHSYGYNPYGEILDKIEADDNIFAFNGEYGVLRESDNLYYMRARYYDASTGRFLSQDPIWNTNLFAFGDNNPVMNNDPKGEYAETILDVASTAYSAYEFYNDPSWANAGFLVWDVASIAVPILPGSYAAKGGKVVNAIGDAANNKRRQSELYSLRAKEDGLYPVFEWGQKEPVNHVRLKQGEVWKYGETINPNKRYSNKSLKGLNVYMHREAYGPVRDIKWQEKMKIIEYMQKQGTLPPGNKIIR